MEDREYMVKRVASAGFFVVSSFSLLFLYKIVLTAYDFPSVLLLTFVQLLISAVIFYAVRVLGWIEFPDLTIDTFWKTWPLPALHFAVVALNLASTKALNLPMYTVLRRFSILFTMVAEMIFLRSRPSAVIKVSVLTMLLGAIIAAFDDLTFNIVGYVLVFCANICTAFQGITIKMKMNDGYLGEFGVVYYNALFMLAPSFLLILATGDVEAVLRFGKWSDPYFLLYFFATPTIGMILSIAVVFCTHFNSALTTTVLGCMKNIFVTYVGMVVGSDYIYSSMNFVGLTVSVVGSLLYSYVSLKKRTTDMVTA